MEFQLEENIEILSLTKFKKLFPINNPLNLECGKNITDIEVAFQTYGELNSKRDNVILICHALTGNAHAAGIISEEEVSNSKDFEFLYKYNIMNFGKHGWWDQLIGSGKVFDTNKYFIVCSNFIGSCYGTLGPSSKDINTNQAYRMNFPLVTIRDMVKVQYELLKSLGVNKLFLATGGSLGGMQVLELAIMYPDFVQSIIPIATSARHSAWGIALNETASNAIMNDPIWENGNYKLQPANGLSLARKIAMISYRSKISFDAKFGREIIDSGNSSRTATGEFQIQKYLNHQGEKLSQRFDANSYLYITKAMNLHDITTGRGSFEDVLSTIKAKTLNIGISTDILYPPEEQIEMAARIHTAEYEEINSIYGHDAFLIEFSQLNNLIKKFIENY